MAGREWEESLGQSRAGPTVPQSLRTQTPSQTSLFYISQGVAFVLAAQGI